MYNRYIPADTAYTQVKEPAPQEEARSHREPENRPGPDGRTPVEQPRGQGNSRPSTGGGSALGFRPPPFPGGKEGLSALFAGKERGGLAGMLKTLHLEEIDPGDVLLLLIVLYLLVEGDDLELVIALGLVLIMGLGEEKNEKKESQES